MKNLEITVNKNIYINIKMQYYNVIIIKLTMKSKNKIKFVKMHYIF